MPDTSSARRGHADRRAVTLHSTSAIHATADAFVDPLRARLDTVMGRYTSEALDLIERFVGEVRETVESYSAPAHDDTVD